MTQQKGNDAVPRTSSTIVIGLLAGIFVAVLILIGVIVSGGSSAPPPSPSTADRPLRAGEETTREKLEADGTKVNKPSHAMDSARVESTYEPGSKYRSIVRFELKGRGTASSWGVTVSSNLLYIGEMQTTRSIESNDGKTIVLTQEYDRAQSVRVATRIDNIDLSNMGATGEMTLMFTDWATSAATGITPGWTKNIRNATQFLANARIMKEILSRVATDEDAKVMAYLDSIQGKRVRIRYVNGEGVQSIVPLGCELSGREQDLIFASAVLSDTYVLPDPNAKVGETWNVDAGDVLPMIDPSIHAHLEGTVTAKRGPDEGTGAGRKATINLQEGGFFELRGYDKGNAYYGRWMPSGKMLFSFKDKIVTSAVLSGTFAVEKRSTDHWIFEAKFSAQPRYQVTISSSVIR